MSEQRPSFVRNEQKCPKSKHTLHAFGARHSEMLRAKQKRLLLKRTAEQQLLEREPPKNILRENTFCFTLPFQDPRSALLDSTRRASSHGILNRDQIEGNSPIYFRKCKLRREQFLLLDPDHCRYFHILKPASGAAHSRPGYAGSVLREKCLKIACLMLAMLIS